MASSPRQQQSYNPCQDIPHIDSLLSKAIDRNLSEWEDNFVNELIAEIERGASEISEGRYKKLREILKKKNNFEVW